MKSNGKRLSHGQTQSYVSVLLSVGYSSVAEIVRKIKEGEVQGILLDTYIAGEYQDQLKDLRLQQVIDYTFSYGVVLSRDALALRRCFSHFLESKQSQIYSTISKVIKPLKVSSL